MVAACSFAGNANAAVINSSFNFNSKGYYVINFNTTGGLVDMSFNSGYFDPLFSLFNGAGTHILSTDDTYGLYPRLKQNLNSGNYSLLVTYCCNAFTPLMAGNWTWLNTDGYHTGWYLQNSGVTMSDVTVYLNSVNIQGLDFISDTNSVTITNASPTSVSAPASFALFGLASILLGLMRRNRK